MIIVVASEKGGTGKTTIATNLAVKRAICGGDVLLIDADSQNSSIDFARVRSSEGRKPELTCSSLMGSGIGSELRKLSPKFDDIIVDVGGRDSSTLRSALLVANVLIVPFLASQLDTWGLERMNSIVGEVLALNDKLITISFLNKLDANVRIGLTEDASTLADGLEHLNFKKTITVGYRVAFRRAIADGLSVEELYGSRKDDKAATEIHNLYCEIYNHA